jgi:hypothetical protein
LLLLRTKRFTPNPLFVMPQELRQCERGPGESARRRQVPSAFRRHIDRG